MIDKVKAAVTHPTTRTAGRVLLSVLMTGAFELYKQHQQQKRTGRK